MIQCPRCRQSVDETQRATCPACFGPLPAPTGPARQVPVVPPIPTVPPLAAIPQQQPGSPIQPAHPQQASPRPGYAPQAPAGYAQAQASANAYTPPPATGSPAALMPGYAPPAPRPVRTDLTGAPVEDAPAGVPAAQAGGGLPSLPAYITGAPRPGYNAPTAYSRSAGSGSVSSGMSGYLKIRLAMGAVGLLIGLVSWIARSISGNGGSFEPFSAASSNPQASRLASPSSAAQAAMEAFHNQDWRSLYYDCVFEANEHKSPSEADAFTREISRSAMLVNNPLSRFGLMRSATQFAAEPATVIGNQIDVATTWTVPYQGEILTLRGRAHMVRQGKLWQLNLTDESAQSLDDLLGTVVGRTGSGPAVVLPRSSPFAWRGTPSGSGADAASPPPPAQPGSPGYTPTNQPGSFQPGQPFIPGQRFVPGPHFVPGPRFMPGQRFVPGPRFIPGGRFGPGSQDPAGQPYGQGSSGGGNSFGNGNTNESQQPGSTPPSGAESPPTEPGSGTEGARQNDPQSPAGNSGGQ